MRLDNIQNNIPGTYPSPIRMPEIVTLEDVERETVYLKKQVIFAIQHSDIKQIAEVLQATHQLNDALHQTYDPLVYTRTTNCPTYTYWDLYELLSTEISTQTSYKRVEIHIQLIRTQES